MSKDNENEESKNGTAPEAMESITHSQLVETLSRTGAVALLELTESQSNMLYGVMSLADKAGDLQTLVKDSITMKTPVEVDNMIEMLGTIEFHLEGIRQTLHVERDYVIEKNIESLTTGK